MNAKIIYLAGIATLLLMAPFSMISAGPTCGTTPCIDSADIINGEVKAVDFEIPLKLEGSVSGPLFSVKNKSTIGILGIGGGWGLRGESKLIGTQGWSKGSIKGAGLEGHSAGSQAYGLWAGNTSTGYGLYAQSNKGIGAKIVHLASKNYGIKIGRAHV